MFPVGTSFGSLLTTPTSTIAAINRLLVGGVASRFIAHPTEQQVNNENDDRKNGGVLSGHSTFTLETKELTLGNLTTGEQEGRRRRRRGGGGQTHNNATTTNSQDTTTSS